MRKQYKKEIPEIIDEIIRLSKIERELKKVLDETEKGKRKEKRKLWTRIKHFFPILSPRQQIIMTLRLKGELCLDVIGKKLDMTRERVRHIEQNSFDKINNY